jgi:hypothetical protein
LLEVPAGPRTSIIAPIFQKASRGLLSSVRIQHQSKVGQGRDYRPASKDAPGALPAIVPMVVARHRIRSPHLVILRRVVASSSNCMTRQKGAGGRIEMQTTRGVSLTFAKTCEAGKSLRLNNKWASRVALLRILYTHVEMPVGTLFLTGFRVHRMSSRPLSV